MTIDDCIGDLAMARHCLRLNPDDETTIEEFREATRLLCETYREVALAKFNEMIAEVETMAGV